VIRISGLLVLLQMAGIAITRNGLIITADVALRTRNRRMSACERESGDRRVVERGVCPTYGGMTERAVHWKTSLNVIRICRGVVLREMASIAVLGCTGKLTIGVTLIALEAYMRTDEGESCL